jgi:hypothetical protein
MRVPVMDSVIDATVRPHVGIGGRLLSLVINVWAGAPGRSFAGIADLAHIGPWLPASLQRRAGDIAGSGEEVGNA